ncbi:MAG TPA: hypothetical protein PKE69_10030 [Pyrinomonadaceae bacterium]|nr:hypothetical protein [Pyrinomonadaceae bacterium]
MQIDMSPEAITNRLKIMEQLWELSVNLMQAKEISETALLSEKSLENNWNNPQEEKAWQHLADISPID